MRTMHVVRRAAAAACLLPVLAARPAPAQQVQISEVSPAQLTLPVSGPQTVMIRGAGFNGASRVSFNGANLSPSSVTPTQVTVVVPAHHFTSPFLEARDFRDGVARVAIYVINGPGSSVDHPSARIIYPIYQAGHAPSAPVHARPVVTGIAPANPVPEGSELVVTGDHLDAPTLSVVLWSRDPGARVSSYSRDRHLTRSKNQIRIPLADVAPGSYRMEVTAIDAAGDDIGKVEADVVVGAPTRLGAPTIRATSPEVLRMGRLVQIRGANFGDRVRVELTPGPREGAGAGHAVLTRRPGNAGRQDLFEAEVPESVTPGRYVLTVQNPGDGTPAAVREVTVLHPSQPETAVADPTGAKEFAERMREYDARKAALAESQRGRALATDNGLCLSGNGGPVTTVLCTPERSNLFVHHPEDGTIRRSATGSGQEFCLTGQASGEPVRLVACNGSAAQKWWYFAEGLQLQNQSTRLCMDIEGENRREGARIINWQCQTSRPWNQTFVMGQVVPEDDYTERVAGPLNVPVNVVPNARDLISTSGAWVIATGGGNVVDRSGRIIAPGGGNLIAPGGGNLISAGGGNLISAGGGNIIAPGGGNLIAPGGGN